ncbi:hypothetical protein ACXYMU_03705 [Pontibacter sp. CAU 1760]
MKKITFVAAALVFAGFISNEASAQTAAPAQQEQAPAQQQEDKREKVTPEQLPAPVTTTLANEVYKDWTVGDIYKVTATPAGKPLYEVTMVNAAGQKGLVLLDAEGKDASEKE